MNDGLLTAAVERIGSIGKRRRRLLEPKLTTAIKMNDKLVALAATAKEQQARIEELTERRLEATFDVLMRTGGSSCSGGRKPRRLPGS